MPTLCTPPCLYVLCLDALAPRYEKLDVGYDWDDPRTKGPLDKVAGKLVEDLLLRAYCNASNGKRTNDGAGSWNYDWKVFFTPRIESAVITWDKDLLKFMSSKCKNVCRVLVSRWKKFTPESLSWLPPSVITVDFDGELFHRGRCGPALQHLSATPCHWLPEAEALFKAIRVWQEMSIVPFPITLRRSPLFELHLGNVHVTTADLQVILKEHPNLSLLRHYQLVTALYEMHLDEWRGFGKMPCYGLSNLDVDFSHVTRCRMSPEAVLPSDALQLAVSACPGACMIRVRYDCSTPHDVLSPLLALRRILEFSVVCVSSGERTLLDFSDLVSILKKFGPHCMTSLELKVIEEVDVHVIFSCCDSLKTLMLSGCGNVSPPTCDQYHCKGLALRSLKQLFFADGDDFSWDHAPPQCFWPTTLGSGKTVLGSTHRNRLEGIFLESPRISPATLGLILKGRRKGRRLFPDLQVLSLCRYPEIRLQELAAFCNADVPGRRTLVRYVRVTQCDKIGAREGALLKEMLAQCKVKDSVVINIGAET